MLPIATVELQASETFAQTASAAHLQAMHQANAKCMVCWAKKNTSKSRDASATCNVHHLSTCARHPCIGYMLLFSALLQFSWMIPKKNRTSHEAQLQPNETKMLFSSEHPLTWKQPSSQSQPVGQFSQLRLCCGWHSNQPWHPCLL